MTRHAVKAVTFAGRRQHNEDAVLHWSRTLEGKAVSVIAVADGMGGHAAGDVASQMAIEILEKEWIAFADAERIQDLNALRRFVQTTYRQINAEIKERSEGRPDLAGMGTTLVAVFSVGRKALVANVGDSRAYVLSEEGLSQVSEDHSVVADSIRRGIITPAEAEASPYGHALTRALDGEADVEADLHPADGWIDLPENCVLLVCSDGLSGGVSDRQVARYLKGVDDLEEALEELVALAYEQGSDDNISVAALEVNRLQRTDEVSATGEGLRLLQTARDGRLQHTRAWGGVLVLIGVLSLAAVYLLYFYEGGRIWPFDGSAATLQAGPPDAFQLPFNGDERLAWHLVDAEAGQYRQFQVRFYDEASRPLFRHSIMSDTVLYLSDLHEDQTSQLTSPGDYAWRVFAFADGDTLKSSIVPLEITADSSAQ